MRGNRLNEGGVKGVSGTQNGFKFMGGGGAVG